jgi:IS30 family transposase
MDRGQLEAWLEDGLSLNEIGALTNRDPSTVGYWVKKHGLVANGRDKYAPRSGLSRERLAELVERGLSQKEIAAETNRSMRGRGGRSPPQEGQAHSR